MRPPRTRSPVCGGLTCCTDLFADGREYRGEFKLGKKHGLGTFTFASGRTWTGYFRYGKQHKLVRETAATKHEEAAPAFSTLA